MDDASRPAPFRILGIDPGLRITGYGVIEAAAMRPALVEGGVLSSGEGDLAQRIGAIYDGLVEILEQYKPGAMAVEQLYAHYQHPRTAILMGHARGVVLLAAAQRKIPVVHYSATRIKKTITGSGRAGKDQVQKTVARELGLAQPPQPVDVTDALAAALCHYYIGVHNQ